MTDDETTRRSILRRVPALRGDARDDSGGGKNPRKGAHGAASVAGSAGSGRPFRPPDASLESQDAPVHFRRAVGDLHHRPPEDAPADRDRASAAPRGRTEGWTRPV